MTRFSPLAAKLILLVLIAGCTSYQQKALEWDDHAISCLHLFFEQEARWGDAIHKADKEEALQATDSMRTLLDYHQQYDESKLARTADSLYFSHIRTTMAFLKKLPDSLYPMVTEKALLPEMSYTYREEKTVMDALRYTDSVVTKKMETLKQLREEFLQRTQMH